MSPQEFSTLKRYSMKYARDIDDQDDLVLQAYEEGLRLGPKRSMPLLVNFMKLRGKERHRSFVGAKYGGRSIRDAWHYNPVSLSAPVADGHATLGDFIAGYDRDPLGQCVVAGFGDALSAEESKVAEQMISGYNDTEAARKLRMTPAEHHRVKMAVREKAIEHLV
jgi:hypothetical protein